MSHQFRTFRCWNRLLLDSAVLHGRSLRSDARTAAILADAYSDGCEPSIPALAVWNCGDESFWIFGAELEQTHVQKLKRRPQSERVSTNWMSA